MRQHKIAASTMSAVTMLSLALAFRQTSMTIVMPFISTYCKSLLGYTSLGAGLAVGIFGLMQAVFQIPFGVLSDRFGNKRMMLIGLTQVVLGLVLAYFAKNIGLLIFARALQGSGAVIGVGYSWAASIAGEKERIRAMSILGAFVSAAAALAFAAGPLLREVMSVNHMFLACAILLFLTELYILFFIRDGKEGHPEPHPDLERRHIRSLVRNRSFVQMNLAAFFNNYMMMSVFYAVPIYLAEVTGETGMWKVFLPAILTAILVMKFAVKWTQKGFGRKVLLLSFLLSSCSLFLYFDWDSYPVLLLGTTLYMCGYITIATIAASNVNETVDDGFRGTANGIFNSFQYVGSFAGALLTGFLWEVSQRLTWSVTIGIGVAGCLLMTCGNRSRSVMHGEECDK